MNKSLRPSVTGGVTAFVDVFSQRAKRSRNKSGWMWKCFSGNDPNDNADGKVMRTRKPSGLQNAWRRMVEDEPGEFLRVVIRLRFP
jgi:hypothetical protein